MHETGCSEMVHWDNPDGGTGKEVGRGFRTGDTCTLVAGSCWCVAETITVLWSNWPPIKINKLKKIQLDLKKRKKERKSHAPE